MKAEIFVLMPEKKLGKTDGRAQRPQYLRSIVVDKRAGEMGAKMPLLCSELIEANNVGRAHISDGHECHHAIGHHNWHRRLARRAWKPFRDPNPPEITTNGN